MFDDFFIFGALPPNRLIGVYDMRLVALSYVIAVIASYLALDMATHLRFEKARLYRIFWHIGGALAMGAGIWAMHFTGMLAYDMSMEHHYHVGLSFLSFLVPVALSAIVLEIIKRPFRWHRTLLASPFLGFGIALMHYIGMEAMQMRADLRYRFDWFSVSLLIAVAASAAALWLISITNRERQRHPLLLKIAAALVMGAAICGMHYTGMYAAVILPYADCRFGPQFNENMELAFGVAAITLLIMSIALATLSINRRLVRHLRNEVERRVAEARANETLLNTVIEHMPLGLFAKNAKDDYRWLLWNRKAAELFEMNAEQMIGRVDSDNFPPEEAAFFRATDENVMASRKVMEIPSESVTTKRGTWMAHTIKVPIYDEKGDASILLGLFEDITERLQAEVRLQEATESATAANLAKSEFLANMSHELRTPLNSILGMMRLLRESRLDPSQRELADTVFQASVNLLEIVNDILDLSKIEAKEMTLEQIGIDVVYQIQSVADYLRHSAREKRLELALDLDAIPYVIGDPTRLSQIVINLLGNAIKYTERGTVRVHLSCRPLAESKIELRCEIEDSGIGIPYEKQQSIFDKFVQADTSTTRKYGGTGLGLTITRQLVEMMGGTIGVTSVEGQGSTFWFTVPMQTTETLDRESQVRRHTQICGTIPAANVRVLIAEDHPMNQLYMTKLMEKFGITQVAIAGNGKEALARLEAEHWDIVLMDCHMPEMNGLEATLAIRKLEDPAKGQIPIIAMTANAMRGDREKCLRVGMNEYISKPINMDELRDVMGQWIRFEQTTSVEKAALTMDALVDLTNFRSLTGGDMKTEHELISLFLKQSAENLETMHAQCMDGESILWSEAAHMLKGGAASIGAETLRGLCARAQELTIASAEDRVALWREISNAFALVEAYFERIYRLDKPVD